MTAKKTFSVSNTQLKNKAKIDSANLKLDDIGYDYKKTLLAAVVVATVLGLGSTLMEGLPAFLLGYGAALIPIVLVGVGSIAPSLIFSFFNLIRFAVDEEARDKYARLQAGRFLVGYSVGLPVAKFSADSTSSLADFYQIRPAEKMAPVEAKKMYAAKTFSQKDIARYSVVCLAGSVAQCIDFGEAKESNPADINTLFDLLTTVQPTLSPEDAQNHIRWSALTAFEILSARQQEYLALVTAFKAKMPLEECIALLESASGCQEATADTRQVTTTTQQS